MSEKEETEVLDPLLVVRLEKMVTDQIVSNAQLALILNSLERKGGRRKKKENKKAVVAGEGGNKAYRLSNPTVITYAQSEKVWGTWCEKEKNVPVSSATSENKVFVDPLFGFQKFYLRGASLAEMAKRFPAHNWGKYAADKKEGTAGCYLISLDNPLANRTPAIEKELHPNDCYRLDLNLTVELLLTLARLEVPTPSLFFRTTEINGHQDEVCVGLVNGKITFLSEEKVRAQKKMALCLAKFEPWV